MRTIGGLQSSLRRFLEQASEEDDDVKVLCTPSTQSSTRAPPLRLFPASWISEKNEIGKRLKQLAHDCFMRDRHYYRWNEDSVKLFEEKMMSIMKKDRKIDYEGFRAVRQNLRENRLADLVNETGKTAAEVAAAMQKSELYGAMGLQSCHFFYFSNKMDDKGRIPVTYLYDLFRRKALLYDTRIALEVYDKGKGYLTPQNLREYLTNTVECDVAAFRALPLDARPYYVSGLLRALLFFLDPAKRNRIKTDALMTSHLLLDFIELQIEGSAAGWVSVDEQLRILDHFRALSGGRDVLVLSDMRFYGDWSPSFMERVFSLLPDQKMQFDDFIDFQLNVADLGEEAALPFCWKILDVYNTGKITPIMLQRFLVQNMKQNMWDCSLDKIEDLVVEIFDAVKPDGAGHITMADLRATRRNKCILRSYIFRSLFSYNGLEEQPPEGPCDAVDSIASKRIPNYFSA